MGKETGGMRDTDYAKQHNDHIPERCCLTCKSLVEFPRNNRYGDMDHLCIKTGYFTHGTTKDVAKVKRYAPGGRELPCKWEPKKERRTG